MVRKLNLTFHDIIANNTPHSPLPTPHSPLPLFCCLIIFLFFLPSFAAADAPRHALVIGNGGYRHAENLPNTANDASAIAQKLTAMGYTVDLQTDADLAGMTRALSSWVRRLSADRASEGFFWYAGHGMQINGENYLLPVDINAEDEAALIYGSYPLGRLLLSLEQTARNKLNVVVLDACRDNPFRNIPGATRGLSRGFTTVENTPQDIFIMFSTAPGTTAADGERGRNSPFAEAFLRYMDSDEILPVMAGLIARETMRLTDGRQRPYQNGSIVSELYYSLLRGAQQQPSANIPGAGSATTPTGATGVATVTPSRSIEETAVPSPVMVTVPAGTFTMGSPGLEFDRAPFGETAHQVQLRAFYLAAKELTIAEFRRFAVDTDHITTAEAEGGAFAYDETKNEWEFRAGANWRNPGFRQEADHPVVGVSWFDAVRYCNWLSAKEGLRPAYTISGQTVTWDENANGYRLPTEAEWEYACRAGTTGPFFTGARISTAQANYNGNFPYHIGNRGLFRKVTMPAGSFPANEWGFYDMHGNVWEWCWDINGYPRNTSAVVVNPTGNDAGVARINRGGSWASPGKNLRSAARSSDLPETASGSLGFRLARNKE